MQTLIPEKLKQGDEVRVIAPARSMSLISQSSRDIANKRFAELGLKISFGEHVEESDDFISSSIESRIADLHSAFSDKSVKAILTVIGGHNSNQLLKYIDWQLIKQNPKILCGFSDITVLENAIYAKTGLVTYSGPHYSSFGQKLYFDYILEYFKKCLMQDAGFDVIASKEWSDDTWYLDQDKRKLEKNTGFYVLNPGEAKGTALGGNLCSFNLLQGTEFIPNLAGSILFVEDDELTFAENFDRDLQSLIHLPDFAQVSGLLIGRFQRESKVTPYILSKIIKSKKELSNIPVIGNVDFGHTDPKITFPIGGEVEIKATESSASINISVH